MLLSACVIDGIPLLVKAVYAPGTAAFVVPLNRIPDGIPCRLAGNRAFNRSCRKLSCIGYDLLFLGGKLADMGYTEGLQKEQEGVYVKVPVFSFAKLRRVDVRIYPEGK